MSQVSAGSVTSGETGFCLDDANDSSAAGNKIQIRRCLGDASQDWAVWDDGTVRVAGGCLAVSGGGASNGTLIVLEPCTAGDAAEVWAPGAASSLVNPASGKCLDDTGASTASGTQPQIYSCSGAVNQQWGLPGTASGFVTDGVTGKCADDSGNSASAGTKVQIWSCNGGASQKWTAESDGTLRVNGVCLEPSGGGTAANTVIVLEPCSGAAAQAWAAGPDGWMWNDDAGMCLSDPNGSAANGTQLIIAGCASNTQQTWRLPPVLGPAGVLTSGVSGMCADDTGDSASAGTKVQVWSCTGGAAQKWVVQDDGTIRVNGVCLEPSGGAAAAGTGLVIEPCNGAAAQDWAVGPDGAWVTSTAAQLCVTDPGNSTTSGTQLTIAACSGAAGQTWTLPSTTVPAAPEEVTATAGNGQATVSWLPPWSDGGSAVTAYTVTSSPVGATGTAAGTATTATVTGLRNGTSYTFTVTATNTVGTSAPSAPSASVTPVAGGTLFAHDAGGRVTAVFDGSGAGSKISYDPDGNILSVTPMPASTLAVAQVSPPTAAPGATVAVYGTDFGTSASAVAVTIGGAAAAVSSVTPNEITATVPSDAGGSGVSVAVGGVSASGTFMVPAVPPTPAITSLSEQIADPGATLTVTGTGFSTNPALDVASIDGTKVGVTAATTTALTIALPTVPVAGNVTVTAPGGTTTSSGQIITVPQPYMAANVGFAGELANATQTTITLSQPDQIALALFSVPAGKRASVAVNANVPDSSGEMNQYTIDIWGPQGRWSPRPRPAASPATRAPSTSLTAPCPDSTRPSSSP